MVLGQSSMQNDPASGLPRPYFASLMTFPAACFIAAAMTDLIYARSANMTWETFSIWLLTIGLITAGVFVVIGLIQALGQHRWPSLITRIGYAIVLVLSLFNAFVHSRDGYTSVVPAGLTISVVVVAVLAATWVLNQVVRSHRSYPASFHLSERS